MTQELLLCDTGSHLRRDHEVIERIAVEVQDLLRAATRDRIDGEREGTELGLWSPITFRDGFGSGHVVESLFWYSGDVRVDLTLEHDRMFARPDSMASERQCHLNDFVASFTLGPDEDLPAHLCKEVMVGIENARRAVSRHNEQFTRPWNQIHVAAQHLLSFRRTCYVGGRWASCPRAAISLMRAIIYLTHLALGVP